MPYIEDWVGPIPAIRHVMVVEGCGRIEAMRQISAAARDGKLHWTRSGSNRFDWDGLKLYRSDLFKLWPPRRPDEGSHRRRFRIRLLPETISLGEAVQEVYEFHRNEGGLVPAIRVLVAILTTGRAGRARALLDGAPGEIDPEWWSFAEIDLSDLATIGATGAVRAVFRLPDGRVIYATEIVLSREAWESDLPAAILAVPKRFPEQDAWEHRALRTTPEKRAEQEQSDQGARQATPSGAGEPPTRARLSGSTTEIWNTIRQFLLKQGSGSERELLPALRAALPYRVPRKLFREVRDDLVKEGLFSKPQRGAPKKGK
jgi:hypothetical protein